MSPESLELQLLNFTKYHRVIGNDKFKEYSYYCFNLGQSETSKKYLSNKNITYLLPADMKET